MSLAHLALAGAFALVAAVAGTDAARRDGAWLQAGIDVGCVVLFGCSVVLLYTDPLAVRYATMTGRTESALSPRELLVLFGGVAAAFTIAVLAAYGLLTRTRLPT
ncbi:hypothetical protein ACFQJ5_00340 [Halomicroarcula sp. GCM10025324]|uniref:hypothetical protein n=1 Tax=Haloarcula TaxID=2237 RepID=UPI0023E8720E|nr:hypothetical protein [Halomicroarcula sp. ZS-22-S1]